MKGKRGNDNPIRPRPISRAKRKARPPAAPGIIPGLTIREYGFVMAMIGECNFVQNKSAVAAGYSPKTASAMGSQLMRKAHIVEAISDAMTKRSKLLRIDNKTVLYEAWLLFADCKEKSDRTNALKALEMVGKHVDVQAFRQQVGLGNPDGTPIEFDLSGFTTDDKITLLRFLERAGAVEPGSTDLGAAAIDSGGSSED